MPSSNRACSQAPTFVILGFIYRRLSRRAGNCPERGTRHEWSSHSASLDGDRTGRLVALAGDIAQEPAGCRRDPRGGRAGDPRRGAFSHPGPAQRWIVGRRPYRHQDRNDQPGNPRPAHGRAEKGFAERKLGARLSAQVWPRSAQQHLRHCTSDHGLRGGRARARLAADCLQRELAGVVPDQGGRPDPLAGLLDLFQLEEDPARRQLEYPVCTARTQCRQRGRRPGQAGGLGPLARLLGAISEARGKLGLHARLDVLHGQHDLRGDLQPGDHRAETVPGFRITQGRSDSRLRQGQREPSSPARHRLVGQSLRGRPELWQWPAVEALLPIRPGTSRAASGHSFLRPARLVPPGRRGTRPRTEQALRLLARGQHRGRPGRRHQLCRSLPGQGPRPGPGQQAAPRPGKRLGQRSRRRSQPGQRRFS